VQAFKEFVRIVPPRQLKYIRHLDLTWHLESPNLHLNHLNQGVILNMYQPQTSLDAKSAYFEVWDMLSSLSNLRTLRVCIVVPPQGQLPEGFEIIWLLPMLKLSQLLPEFVFAIAPPFVGPLREKRDRMGYSFQIVDASGHQYSGHRRWWL
jgi:hypothetical protein